jgi:DNA-binding MarR family transcriptional regulator
MTDSSRQDIEDLADIYQALGNQTRLNVLLQLARDEPVSHLTDELGITRSGLQKNIERLISSELVYRPKEEDSNTYALTPLGQHYIEIIQEDRKKSLAVLKTLRKKIEQMEEEQSETKKTLEEAGVDVTEFEQKLKAEAWQNIWEDAEDEL